MRRTAWFLAAAMVLSAAPAWADHDHTQKVCPDHRYQRTPAEVIADHLAAVSAVIAGADPSIVLCDYADDATVILGGSGAVTGHDQIKAAFGGFTSLLGGHQLDIYNQDMSGPMVLLGYGGSGPAIPCFDAADTFVIEHGLIRYQTVHLYFGAACPAP